MWSIYVNLDASLWNECNTFPNWHFIINTFYIQIYWIIQMLMISSWMHVIQLNFHVIEYGTRHTLTTHPMLSTHYSLFICVLLFSKTIFCIVHFNDHIRIIKRRKITLRMVTKCHCRRNQNKSDVQHKNVLIKRTFVVKMDKRRKDNGANE